MGFWGPATLVLFLAQQQAGSAPVGIEMRNVHLRVAADVALEVKWLKGSLRSTSARPPVFDDQHSYTLEVDDGEMAIDAQSLTSLVNRGFDYKGSALSNLRIAF